MPPRESIGVSVLSLVVVVVSFAASSLCLPVAKNHYDSTEQISLSLLDDLQERSLSVSESASFSLPYPPSDDETPDFGSPSSYPSPSVDPSISGIPSVSLDPSASGFPSVSLDPSFIDASSSSFPSAFLSNIPSGSGIAASGDRPYGKVMFRVIGHHEEIDVDGFVQSLTTAVGMPLESIAVEAVVDATGNRAASLDALQKHAVDEADLLQFLRGGNNVNEDDDDKDDDNEDDEDDDDDNGDDDDDDDDDGAQENPMSEVHCLVHPYDDIVLESMIAQIEDVVRYGHEDLDDWNIIFLESADGTIIHYRESVSASQFVTAEPVDGGDNPSVSHTDSAIHVVHFTLIGSSTTFDKQHFTTSLAKNMGVPQEQLHIISVIDAAKRWVGRETGGHVIVTVEILHGPTLSSTGATTLLVEAIASGDPIYEELGIVSIQQNDEPQIIYVPQSRTPEPTKSDDEQPATNVPVIAGTVAAAFVFVSVPAAILYRKRTRKAETKVALSSIVDADTTMDNPHSTSMAIL